MRLVFDLEGNGLKYEHQCDTLWCLVAYDLDSGETYEYGSAEGLGAFREEVANLFDKADALIGHNILDYDLTVLDRLGYYPYAKAFPKAIDTLVMSQLFNSERPKPAGLPARVGPHSLEAWGVRNRMPKPGHEDWTQFSNDMLHRCREDVRNNVIVYERLLHEQNVVYGQFRWDMALKLEHRVRSIQSEQEMNGWLIDLEGVKRKIEWLQAERDRLYAEIIPQLDLDLVIEESKARGEVNYVRKPFKANGRYAAIVERWLDAAGINDPTEQLVEGCFSRVRYEQLNLGSTAKLKDQLLKLGWEPDEYNFNDDGQRTSPKITEFSLESLRGDLGQNIRLWVVYRHRQSQLEGWLRNTRPDGRIPAEGNTLGAVTGRYTHRVLTNVPKASPKVVFGCEMRECFIAPQHRKVVGVDAEGLELRLLAHFMGDVDFIRAVCEGDSSEGTDAHTLNQRAAQLDTRDQAKTFIYALIYGAGDAKIGKVVGGTAEDGRRLKATFFKRMPALKRVMDEAKAAAKRGYIIGEDGRRMPLRQPHKALNTKIQGLGALVMKVALCYLRKWIAQHNVDAKLVGNFHDEFQADVAEKDVELYGRLAVQSIKQAGQYLRLSCPMDAEYQVGNSWAETH